MKNVGREAFGLKAGGGSQVWPLEAKTGEVP
jgi:hypothetical protein